MILSIDDIISAAAPTVGAPPPGGPYGGMPEY
jgi:hypothetical protein